MVRKRIEILDGYASMYTRHRDFVELRKPLNTAKVDENHGCRPPSIPICRLRGTPLALQEFSLNASWIAGISAWVSLHTTDSCILQSQTEERVAVVLCSYPHLMCHIEIGLS